jgi:DNA oxidative demethylase
MRGITAEPAGFSYTEEFVDRAAEDALLTYLSSLAFEPVTIRGNTARRTVRHFGLRYDYGSRVLRETEAIPAELEPQIRDAEEFARLPPGAIVEVLVNRYPPGAGIGWHNDADVYKTIIGISLGSACNLQLRTKAANERRVFEKLLMPRSAYIMTDDARDSWQHRIPATKNERCSLTLRSLSAA